MFRGTFSLNTSRGTPNIRIANARASHTRRAMARSTTRAEITNRLWSSIPDTIDALHPFTSWTPPTTSICHSRGPSWRVREHHALATTTTDHDDQITRR
jgi:hypothetical protein